MFVKNRMATHLLTVSEETPILEATQLMREKNVRRLPVVKDEKVVGIVTENDLLRVSPSSATSLSVFEMNYLLSKLLIKKVMTKPVITIDPEATLEEAALLMREKNIGALPVIKDWKLVGIITESNIFDAFIDLMGLKEAGTRITIDTEDRIGVIAEVTDIIRSFGINIISIAALHTQRTEDEVVLRLDTKEPQAVVDAIRKRGYKVVHVASLPV
jgi:acetoin utilization protein AcuB